MPVLCLARNGIWKWWFLWREENRRTGGEIIEQGENQQQQQIQPTYGTTGHIGGRRALSTLRHPCALNRHAGHI